MRNKKNEYKCIFQSEFFYSCLITTFLFIFIAIILTIMIIVEKIQGMVYGFLVLSILLSIISFCCVIKATSKKFFINFEYCGIYSNKKLMIKCSNSKIRRIIVYCWVRDVKYIILDCDEYPFLSSKDIFLNRSIVIRYSSNRLKNIQKYCSSKVEYRQREYGFE